MKKLAARALLLVCGLGLSLVCAAESTTEVRVVSRGDDTAEYAISMVRLALQKVGKPFRVNVDLEDLSAPKLREELVDGTIDVIWTATNLEMEQIALPVRVPLFKGLLGYRVLLVHKNNKHMFDSVMTFEQAQRFRYGQGMGWTDTTILEANGLDVIAANQYEGLFHMTDGGRFDAFPRGVHEPWAEVAKRPELELTVDTNLLFVYTSPYYLFVAPGRPDLANDIHQGLLMAIDDGSFDELFYSNPMVKTVVQNGNLAARRVFKLNNPQLPPRTPLDNPKLWVDVSKL